MSLLVPPSVGLHVAWLEAHREWGDGLHEDGFGLIETDDIRSSEGFRGFVDRLLAREASDGGDGGTFRWIVEDGRVLGGIALRHESAQEVEVLGHVGYGLRPSARGRGLAAAALREMLGVAEIRGMNRVLLACFLDNVPSIRTIKRCGGVLDRTVATDCGTVAHYAIRL
jgi:predicted acetyltransferase